MNILTEGNSVPVVLLLIPGTLASLAGLLFLTEALERRSSDVVVRMALRSSRNTPEATERLVAAELSHRLQVAGLGRRPLETVAMEAAMSPDVAMAVL
ncbi:MAG: hypothetical protein M3503_06820, partial [Actinomycetota bacterium]|nr:hypothetical protein [Actinomycetota bacterium]